MKMLTLTIWAYLVELDKRENRQGMHTKMLAIKDLTWLFRELKR